MTKIHSWMLAVLIVSCAGVGGFVDMKTPAGRAQAASENLKKTVVSVHNGLYLPAMQVLGAALDTGHVTPAQEAQIQSFSEQYQRLKTELDGIVRLIDATNVDSQSIRANSKLQELLNIVTQLQTMHRQGELKRYGATISGGVR